MPVLWLDYKLITLVVHLYQHFTDSSKHKIQKLRSTQVKSSMRRLRLSLASEREQNEKSSEEGEFRVKENERR